MGFFLQESALTEFYNIYPRPEVFDSFRRFIKKTKTFFYVPLLANVF